MNPAAAATGRAAERDTAAIERKQSGWRQQQIGEGLNACHLGYGLGPNEVRMKMQGAKVVFDAKAMMNAVWVRKAGSAG